MSLSKRLRFEILKRDGFACQYCGAKAPGVFLQVDHIYPVSRGGPDTADNLRAACADCNIGKFDRPISDDKRGFWKAKAIANMGVDSDAIDQFTCDIYDFLERHINRLTDYELARCSRLLYEYLAYEPVDEWIHDNCMDRLSCASQHLIFLLGSSLREARGTRNPTGWIEKWVKSNREYSAKVRA